MRAEGALKITGFGTACAPTPAQHGVLIKADNTGLPLRAHDGETAVSTATATQAGTTGRGVLCGALGPGERQRTGHAPQR